MCLALAALSVTTTAAAQNAPEPGETSLSQGSSTGRWRTYPRERHLLLRAEALGAIRLQDYFDQGAIAPLSALVQASYAFVHVGSFMIGPSLGVQLGFDRTGMQYSLQPGVLAYRRFSGRFAMTGRVDANVLVTRGACDQQPPLPVLNPAWRGGGVPMNQTVVPAPSSGYCPTIAMGFEAAVGAALFVRSGFALTSEITFNLYGGDGGLTYPFVGLGLGVLFDHEVLP